jgi:hypothetical protein
MCVRLNVIADQTGKIVLAASRSRSFVSDTDGMVRGIDAQNPYFLKT